MKAATYTDEQIIEAGRQLLAENKRVTPFGIRKIIGGGNPERIKNIWQASQNEALEGQIVTEQVELPTEFADSLDMTKSSLDELAQRMYGRAQEIAESRVRESISASRKAKETAETEIAEAMEAVADLDHEKENLQIQVDELRTQLQKQISENARLQERVGVLTQKSEKSTKELKGEKAKRVQLEKEVTTLEVKNELTEKQIEAIQKKIDTSRQQEEKAKEEAAELRGKIAIMEKTP